MTPKAAVAEDVLSKLARARMLVRPGVRLAVLGSAYREGDSAGSFADMSALEAIRWISWTSLEEVLCRTPEAFLQESPC